MTEFNFPVNRALAGRVMETLDEYYGDGEKKMTEFKDDLTRAITLTYIIKSQMDGLLNIIKRLEAYELKRNRTEPDRNEKRQRIIDILDDKV
jgi:hypothetical protein